MKRRKITSAQAHAGSTGGRVLLPISGREEGEDSVSVSFSKKGGAQPLAGALAGESRGQNSRPSLAVG